jgi:hypothetical protein
MAVRHPADEGKGAMKRKTAVAALRMRCATRRVGSMASMGRF